VYLAYSGPTKYFKRNFPQITQIKSKRKTGELMGIKKPGRMALPGAD
jgi:hypothetical protein